MNLAGFARLAVFFLAAAPTLSSLAGPFEDADSAYKSGDYATALRLWHELAEHGDTSAQNRLGVMYSQGRGVTKNEAEAVRWYRKAAEQGYAAGQTNLGYMYANGRGVAKDDTEAAEWYRKAAEQGNALGQNNLGVMYRDGRGVAKDDVLAVTWFRKAAEQGNALGQKNLAAMYEQGRGDTKSDGKAITALPAMRANTNVGRGADFAVGRVTLRMPDDAWESIGVGRRAVPYSGDRSGEIPFVTRHLLLRDSAGKFRAALTVGAGWGVGAVRMTWTQSCRPQQNTHVVDNTRGDVNGRDCLRVTGPIPTQRYLALAAPELLAELTGRNVALPRTGYAVSDEAGLENGTYLSVQAVFAADFKLPNDAGSQDSLPAGVKLEAVAWGARLAEAVRSSVHSPSGTLILPVVAGKAANQ